VSLQIDGSDRSGKLVKELTGISHGYDGQLLINGLDFLLLRGDRVGIIGANGSGKSTLLKIILGEITPDRGQVRTGTKLDIAYFDQMRAQLDPEKTVAENVAEGKDFIDINNRPIHVISYLADFLFPAERARTPVKVLSGGETNRLLLAKLFARPTNLLVLDEPTNDLDIETLELLEELLLDFKGTVLLVTHDRAFLDNVVTSTLVFESAGKVQEYVGGYGDWIKAGGRFTEQIPASGAGLGQTKGTKAGEAAAADATGDTDIAGIKAQRIAARQQSQVRRNLDRKLLRELESLPDELERLEQQIDQLHRAISAPGFYDQAFTEQEKVLENLKQLELALADKYARWEELDGQMN
jgi:ATP-binding cassette subfamily F protein uup